MSYMMNKFIWAWILLGIAIGASFFFLNAATNANFVKGKYGAKCYMSGSEHGNIHYPLYYETLDECLRSFGTSTPPEEDLHIKRKDEIIP